MTPHLPPTRLPRCLAALALIALIPGYASAGAPYDRNLQQIAADAARNSRAGAIIAVQGCGLDRIVAAGVADRRTQTRMPPFEALRIGSVGKLYVAAVIHQLAQAGRLDLDAPVASQLPPGTLTGIAGAEATPRQLLKHTGGVPDYYTPQTIAGWDWTQPITADRVLAAIRGLPATTQPGGAYHYSNTGWHILGLLAEHVTGHSLGTLLESQLLVPLGLEDTRYNTSVPGGTIHGYGLPDSPDADTHAYAENTGADSGITAPAQEVAQFLRALFLPGGQLLQVGEAMLADPVERDGPRHLAGAGAEITVGSSGLRVVGHTGDVAGYLTFAFAAPSLDVAMVGHINADKPAILADMVRGTIRLVQARCTRAQAGSPAR